MTEPENTGGPSPNRSTGPKTPEGKHRSSLNAYRHGLTGQRRFNSSTKLNIQTPSEQQSYDEYSKITLDGLAPFGDYERVLAQSIADDRWRLNRARTIEASMFALGLPAHGEDDSGRPQVDEAFAQGRTWIAEATVQTSGAPSPSTGSAIRRARSTSVRRGCQGLVQGQRQEQLQEAIHQAWLL